jgi:AraC-like DNA-binding protein
MISDFLHTTNLYADSSFPYVMFHVNSNSCVPPGPGYHYLHWHEDLQYTLVTNGDLSIQVNGINYELRCGDAIFINSGHLHMIQKLSSNGTYVSFNFSPKILTVFEGSLLEHDYVLPYITNYNYPIMIFSSENTMHQKALTSLTQLMELDSHLEQFGVRYHICSLLMSLWLYTISLFYSKIENVNKVLNKKQEYLHLMLSYIHQNYSLDLSLQDIATSAHVSESECCRCFKSILHTTPYVYLLNFRIAKSTELLAETNYSVAEIANMIGYNDSSHYIQYFKKIHNLTPNQYRQK